MALIKNCIKAPSEVLLWGFPHMFNTIWCSRKCPKLLTSRFKILTRIWTCQEKWNWLHGLNLSRKVNLASRIWICHNIMYLLVYTIAFFWCYNEVWSCCLINGNHNASYYFWTLNPNTLSGIHFLLHETLFIYQKNLYP